nr:hypothetical protein CFP56_32129 [Quercus suber]
MRSRLCDVIVASRRKSGARNDSHCQSARDHSDAYRASVTGISTKLASPKHSGPAPWNAKLRRQPTHPT